MYPSPMREISLCDRNRIDMPEGVKPSVFSTVVG